MGRRRKNRDAAAQKPEKDDKQKYTPADSLPVPNQMAPIYENERSPFPELYLMKSDGGVHPTGLLFVDDKHGAKDWWDRDTKAPPTWMDPCVFTQMAFANPDVKHILERVKKKNAQELGKGLTDAIDKVFVNEYLVYALRQFRKSKQMYSEWMMARYTCVEGAEVENERTEDSGRITDDRGRDGDARVRREGSGRDRSAAVAGGGKDGVSARSVQGSNKAGSI